jgi:predicted TIM-barrel fold metal-dependent hydrolase
LPNERPHSRPLQVSADSHVVEAPELFAPLERRFGDRAPRIRVVDPSRGPQLDLGDGQLGLPIAGFFLANVDFKNADTAGLLAQGYDLARPGVYDVAARLLDQDTDGIDAEVLYPSVIFNLYQLEDQEILQAAFRAYNDWTAAYCAPVPRRLFPLACIQLYDLDEAIVEMARAKELGHVGVCIAATAPPERRYTDPWYDPFWAAAQEMEMPLTMHLFTGATPNHGLPFRDATYSLAFAGVMFTISDIISSGVCERFPRLKFVITEFESGWVAIMLRRLDWAYQRAGGARTAAIPEPPSTYWANNFLVTFEDDDIGVRTRDVVGVETLLWGNDYPHGDSIFPNSPVTMDRIFADCTPAERRAMTSGNVVDLYRLPLDG